MAEIDIKVLLVGDPNVGKTSLLFRYIDGQFPEKHLSTVGVEYRIQIFKFRGFNIKLMIWDTAGQERFHSITNSYFHNADGAFFVFDITNRNSFSNIKKWIIDADNINNSLTKLLLGNKCDLKHIKAVSEEEIKKFCVENNLEWFETSAKEDINLKEAFNKIVELIFDGQSDDKIKQLYSPKLERSTISERNFKKGNVVCC